MENKTSLIQQIDNRIEMGEYKNFPSTRNALVKIRGKLLHNEKLNNNDHKILQAEQYFLG